MGDKSTPTYREAIEAIKATANVLVLELRRDPDYPEQTELLRDRVWNHSIALYRTLQAVSVVTAASVFGLLVWLALQDEKRLKSPFEPHDEV